MGTNEKGYRKVLMLLCLTMLIIICLPGMPTQAASKKTKALKAYSAFLKKNPSKQKSIGSKLYDASFCLPDTSYIDDFCLCDIDNNGVPELFTTTYVNFRWYIVRVYTWKNGRVAAYKFSDGTNAVFDNRSTANGYYYFTICQKKHLHNEYSAYIFGDIKSYSVYKVKSKKLKTYLTYSESTGVSGLPATATKNGKKISVKKYNSYTKGCKSKKLKWYSNSKSNRSKLKKGKCTIN